MEQKHAITEVPHVRGVWQYRGVPFSGEARSWQTYCCIIVRGDYPGSTRLRATSRAALLRLIDRHIDSGGEIAK